MDSSPATARPDDGPALSRLQAACAGVLDASGFIPGEQAEDRHCQDWLGGRGRPLAVLRPRDPAMVAAAVRVLHGLGQPFVVQGGMTGLVGACVPQPGEVVLSMERLRTIESLDARAGTVVAQAGVPLQVLQEAAEQQGWMFPVDIGSRGSCQVGGLIATNAGGNRVLRFGMMRQQVLGLEVVLPDGRVLSRLGEALKDNAGYDLKHSFIGSEGTLGVVTRARLALQPRPAGTHTAVVSTAGFDQVTALLAHCRQRLGPALTSFEVMWSDYFDMVTKRLRTVRPMFANPGSHLVLVEAMGWNPSGDAQQFEDCLGDFLAIGLGSQAVIANSVAEARSFWGLRDASGEAARAVAPYAGFDVSLPIAAMSGWVSEVRARLALMHLAEVQTYGHLGDGNLHLVVGRLPDAATKRQVETLVHASIGALGGSISGEHGIGFLKKPDLALCRSPEELAVMRALKRTLDPQQLINRGRILDAEPPTDGA